MSSICLRYCCAAAVLAGVVAAMSPSTAQAVIFDNADVNLVVNGGDANNGLIPSNGYFRYTDKASGDETTWSVDPLFVYDDGGSTVLSNGLLSTPVQVGDEAVSSHAESFWTVEARTQLIGQTARTTFNFTANTGTVLDSLGFVFYAENDLQGFANDTAAFTGSIAGGDLRLFQFDTPAMDQEQLFVIVEQVEATNADLTLFGAGDWTGFGTALEAGDLSVLSADGSNFDTSGDLGLALHWRLSGTSASITVDYRTAVSTDLPDDPGDPGDPGEAIPVPAALPAGLALMGLLTARRRRR